MSFFFFAEVGKILFAENLVGEKRRERLHIGECRGTRKLFFFFERGSHYVAPSGLELAA
jgi:hypothetical protein